MLILIEFFYRIIFRIYLLQIGSHGLDGGIGMSVKKPDGVLPVPDMKEQVIEIGSRTPPSGAPLLTVLFFGAVIVRQGGKLFLAAATDNVLHSAYLLLFGWDTIHSNVVNQFSDVLKLLELFHLHDFLSARYYPTGRGQLVYWFIFFSKKLRYIL